MSYTEYTLGIDFGTCFSFPAAVIDDIPTSLLMNQGTVGIPTIFYHDSILREKVGEEAERLGKSKPENCIWNIKSDILNEDFTKSYVLDGKSYSLVTVCARILQQIIDEAVDQIRDIEGDENIRFRKAVISVPVTAGVVPRSILLSAAKIPRTDGGPGLEDVGFIQEPVAAALYYARRKNETSDYILVYDLGGGTFDVSLVQPTSEGSCPYRVIGSDGLRIGGNDFDQLLALYCAAKLQKEHGISNISVDDKGLISSSKKAKEQLSRSEVATVEYDHAGLHKTCSITKDDFEKLISAKVMETVKLTCKLANNHSLIDKDGKLKENVRVVMVGGSSHIPFIKDKLKELLKIKNIATFQPESAIAYGNAIFADDTKSITTISQHSYGDVYYSKETQSSRLVNIIPKGSDLPFNSGWLAVKTVEENQRSVLFQIYENEYQNPELDFNEVRATLGKPKLELEVNFNKPVPENTKLRYILSLSSDNILGVQAKYIDPETGKESEIQEKETKIRLIN